MTADGAVRGVRGCWRPQTYAVHTGHVYPLEGVLFFGDADWSAVLCLVDAGRAVWGAGLGGAYTLRADRLVFGHRFALSAGEPPPDVPGVSRLIVRGAAEERTEECEIDLDDDRLRIRFPSGNAMVFARVAGQ